MSTIESVTIQGIRSFGPNCEDAQVITLSSPVTLIVGDNGCGKTTIIECLKYALTGDVPPGSERGRNFIHDPKMFNEGTTLGQVKLDVRDKQGKHFTVCRSMQITLKRGKYIFETLESTISYKDEDMNGGDASMNSICKSVDDDVDAAMCQFMGVSKAIINNVLFCHQEDSCWPLDEAKKLKEKFDAIFGLSEFNKVIEKSARMRKDEADKLKVKESNLRLLEHYKKEMEDKSIRFKNAQENCEQLNAEFKSCEEEMKPADERLEELRKIEFELAKFQAQKVELQTKQKNCEEQIARLNKNIKKPFEGTLPELENEITLFKEQMLEKRRNRDELEKNVSALKKKEKEFQKRFTDSDKKRSLLEQQRQKKQECVSKRAENLKSLCHGVNITLTEDPELAPETVPDVLVQIENALLKKQSDISEKVTQFDNEDRERQAAIDSLRVELAKVEEKIVTLEKQKTKNEKALDTNKKEIGEIEASSQRIKNLTENIERLNKAIDEMNGKFNQEDIKTDIAAKKAKIVSLQEQFSGLDERLMKLNTVTKLTAEINLKQQELEKKEEDVQRIKSKHDENFKKLFTRAVESNYRREVQGCSKKLRAKIKELNAKANKLRLEQNSCEIRKKNLQSELEALEKQLVDSKGKIYEACNNESYEDTLEKCKATVAKYQIEHGALLSAESMYKRYIEKVGTDPCCPLCHKGMEPNEVTDLTTELSGEISRLPENIKETANLLKSEQKKYEQLLQIKSVIEAVSKLEIDIPNKKAEIESMEASLAKCIEDNESHQQLFSEPNADLELAESMMGDLSLLDESVKEVKRLKDDISKLKAKLPEGFEENVSVDDLQASKKSISEELEAERKTLEEKQTNLEKIITALNKIQKQKNKYQDERIKLQEGQQSLNQLKERQAELESLIENAKSEIEQLRTSLPTMKQNLNTAITDKNRKIEINRKELAQLQSLLDAYKKIDHDIQRLNKEFNQFEKLQIEEKLTNLKTTLDNYKKDIEDKAKEIAQALENFEAIKMECLNQESLERDLKDNREHKLLQEKKVELDKKMESLLEEIGKIDFPNLAQEKKELTKKHDEGIKRKGELMGKIGEIQNQMKSLERELKDPKLKNSLDNYRRAFYEVVASRHLIKELGAYRSGLESSLLKFHTDKMENINRLIREYWRLIYRGNDIDYIEIQTDENNANNISGEKKRNYNYRVIQSKNNTELEMRGRCSAGQRLLASLIIRLALAETFNSDCGVLALDEPTTNLDRCNIIALCEALNRIVEERQVQSNFMLVIITHDEDFISSLGKVGTYHRVFRNDECKSVVRPIKIS